jgi:hypothetical protein
MRRAFSVMLVVIISISLIGCNSKATYHGKIEELKKDSFFLGPLEYDPEVDYVLTNIYFNDSTVILGEDTQLKVGQEVKVWIKKTDEEEMKNLLAEKIEIKSNE